MPTPLLLRVGTLFTHCGGTHALFLSVPRPSRGKPTSRLTVYSSAAHLDITVMDGHGPSWVCQDRGRTYIVEMIDCNDGILLVMGWYVTPVKWPT